MLYFFFLDGEGCERTWSYLNRFIPMTRSMRANTRRWTIHDALNFDTQRKMDEMRKLFKFKVVICTKHFFVLAEDLETKYKKAINTLAKLEGRFDEEKCAQMSEKWSTIVTNLTMTHSARLVSTIQSQITARIENADRQYHYWIDVAKYISFPG